MEIVIEIIKIIPSILWFLFSIIVIFLFSSSIRELLPRLGRIKSSGIEFEFLAKQIDSAIEFAEKTPKWNIEISQLEKDNILKRINLNSDYFENKNFAWIDDEPENIINEISLLKMLKVKIDIFKCNSSFLEDKNVDSKYDLVLSDILRKDINESGLNLLESNLIKNKIPIIFYIGEYDNKLGVPKKAFGITNKPNELFHLIIDVLNRKV